MGVSLDCSRSRIMAAVSKPSMSGILTSSRIAAKSCSRQARRASLPDWALISSWPSPSNTASNATRFSGLSSTSRIFTVSGWGASGVIAATVATSLSVISACRFRSRLRVHLGQPHPEQGHEFFEYDRLGYVVRSSRFDTFFPVTLHRFRSQGNNRQVPKLRV